LINEFAFYEFGAGSDALPVPFAQIVVNDGGMFLREQLLHDDAADVASTTCYEDTHDQGSGLGMRSVPDRLAVLPKIRANPINSTDRGGTTKIRRCTSW